MSTEANTVRCKTCLDSGEVTVGSGVAKAIIERKETERKAWRGLVSRTKFKPCHDCSKPVKPVKPPATSKPRTARRRWTK